MQKCPKLEIVKFAAKLARIAQLPSKFKKIVRGEKKRFSPVKNNGEMNSNRPRWCNNIIESFCEVALFRHFRQILSKPLDSNLICEIVTLSKAPFSWGRWNSKKLRSLSTANSVFKIFTIGGVFCAKVKWDNRKVNAKIPKRLRNGNLTTQKFYFGELDCFRPSVSFRNHRWNKYMSKIGMESKIDAKRKFLIKNDRTN